MRQRAGVKLANLREAGFVETVCNGHFLEKVYLSKIVLDADKIKQVVLNLLSNAIKFSPEGGTIDVISFKKADSIVISVRDQGAGVPVNELENIFDKFVQSSKNKTSTNGTGLGLPICREIIAAHKGRIWAENNPDIGANLSFEIPLSLETNV